MELLERGDLLGANKKFSRALTLEPKFSPAKVGDTLILAKEASSEKDKVIKGKKDEEALKQFKKAKDKVLHTSLSRTLVAFDCSQT